MLRRIAAIVSCSIGLAACSAQIDPQTYYVDPAAPANGVEAILDAQRQWAAVGHRFDVVLGTSDQLTSRILFEDRTYGCDAADISCEADVLGLHQIRIGWQAVRNSSRDDLTRLMAHEIGHGFGYEHTTEPGHIMSADASGPLIP